MAGDSALTVEAVVCPLGVDPDVAVENDKIKIFYSNCFMRDKRYDLLEIDSVQALISSITPFGD